MLTVATAHWLQAYLDSSRCSRWWGIMPMRLEQRWDLSESSRWGSWSQSRAPATATNSHAYHQLLNSKSLRQQQPVGRKLRGGQVNRYHWRRRGAELWSKCHSSSHPIELQWCHEWSSTPLQRGTRVRLRYWRERFRLDVDVWPRARLVGSLRWLCLYFDS